MMIDITKILKHLIEEGDDVEWKSHYIEHLYNMESYHQQEMIKILLCKRPPYPPLPVEINQEINKFISWKNNNKLHTSTLNLTNNYKFSKKTKVSLWRGDIATLSNVTAIVNAANLALLGCFRPSHKCIDNVIHTAAGPDLRQACFELMQDQPPEPTGLAKITPGFNLPAKYVIHTVGPIIHKGTVTQKEIKQLESCYMSCLKKLEHTKGQNKSIAFCCISTGIFAFPNKLASEIAIRTVHEYFVQNPESTITHIIFDVFLEEDEKLYQSQLDRFPKFPSEEQQSSKETEPNIERAKNWLKEADYLIISAGAGLSASEGLNYSSKELFNREYGPFLKYGINTLYETIGFPWPTKIDFWNYFIYHYCNIYKKWPKTVTYERLLELSNKFKDSFVLTSNADGFFVKNGFDNNKVFTIQGNYANIQCLNNCHPDAYRAMEEMVEKYPLKSADDIPNCHFCGSEMTMFLRMGNNLNQDIVKDQREAYHKFMRNILQGESDKKVVILELGVGLNTPSVLRWRNEEKVEQFPEIFKLIRVGMGPSSAVPLNILDNTVVIDADIKQVIELLMK